MTPGEHHVVVLGASPKPHRYSNQAVRLLKSMGYAVTPVHPKAREIEGLPVIPRLNQIAPGPVHTLTLYLGAERSRPLIGDIVALRPKRVIFNPGSESTELQRHLEEKGIHFIHGCTLVMLRIGAF